MDQVDQRKFEKFLVRRGFTLDRVTKHRIYSHPDGRVITLPVHAAGPICGPVLKRAGWTR